MNKNLAQVKLFKEGLRHHQLRAIRTCFEEFNQKGGAVIKLQTGKLIYFARAILLAIFADHPAAVKCSLTGSACPACYTEKTEMANEPGVHGFVLRTPENMMLRRQALQEDFDSGAVGSKARARKR